MRSAVGSSIAVHARSIERDLLRAAPDDRREEIMRDIARALLRERADDRHREHAMAHLEQGQSGGAELRFQSAVEIDAELPRLQWVRPIATEI